MTLLTTPIFDFHNVISALTIPIPTPTPSLVLKTSLYVFRNSSGLLKFCFLTRQNLVLVTVLHYKYLVVFIVKKVTPALIIC